MAVPTRWSHNPAHATPASSYHAHGLAIIRFRSPLLTESLVFSLPAGTEMFHFPAFPPTALCVQAAVTGLPSGRVSPFGDPGITARLAAPPGLSQPPTSFIGSWCRGIHRVPVKLVHRRCSRRPLCSSQGSAESSPGRTLLPSEPNSVLAARQSETLAAPRSSARDSCCFRSEFGKNSLERR